MKNKGDSTPVYSVKIDANGGTFGSNASTEATVKKGGSISLSNYKPTRQDFNFLGWSTSAKATTATYGKTGSYKPSGSGTVYAVWEIIAPPDAAPQLRNSSLDIGAGDAAQVTWSAVARATSYEVIFKDSEGETVFTADASCLAASTVLQTPGVYSAEVRGKNSAGVCESAAVCTITVHAPSTVTFLDYNGAVHATQTVAYGRTADTPADPSRAGYTFTGWDATLYNVTSDRTLTAQYTPIDYNVTFYDFNGDPASVQEVPYVGDTPGSAAAPAESALNAPEGYVLAGWDTDDWRSVTRDGVKVHPCFAWGNEALPIVINIGTITKAGNGYWVSYDIENHVEAGQNGRVVIVLKSGFGKFLTKTESGAFYLDPASGTTASTYSGSIYVPLSSDIVEESFARVEAYVVNSYTSTVPLSNYYTKSIVENDDSDWSAWMTQEEYDAYTGDKSDTQTRTEYSSRDRVISDWMTNTQYLDWAQFGDPQTVKSEYGAWSDWRDQEVTASDYVEVETRQVQTAAAYTQYRYGKYVSTSSGYGTDGDYYSSGWGHFHQAYYRGSNYTTKYTSWSKTKTSPTSTNTYYWSSNNGVGTGKKSGSNWWWNKYVVGGTTYYWQESRTVPATYKTQYRYRTCEDVEQYRYFMWTPWSDWSIQEITASDNTEIQARTMYRVKLPASAAGEGFSISGSVSLQGIEDLAGRQAILNIYKVDEASDYSNEYIAQTTLGANGEYSFTGIHTYEEPSVKTGDFTVTLTIEGTSGPLIVSTNPNIDRYLKAPKKQYTVRFVDGITKELLGEQLVEEGGTAAAPEVPEKEGYRFLGWEYGLTNIRDDMDIKARFVPETYTVVYVDFANSTVAMQTDVPYGTALELNDPPEIEGYIFTGWKAEDGCDVNCVTRSMIVTAQYEKMSYTVRFLDSDGELISEQTIAYGEAAEEPSMEEIGVPDGMYLAGWSEYGFDAVTESLDIAPVVYYTMDAEYVENSLESGVYEGPQTVTLACDGEDTSITYRLITEASLAEEEDVEEPGLDGAGEAEDLLLDGEGESEETGGSVGQVYTGPITITESAILEVTSSQDGANSVTESYEYIIVPEGTRPVAPASLTAEAFSDRVDLSWPAVEGASGYIINRTDVYDNEDRFMTDGTTYSDENVTAITDYYYTVQAYTIYTVDDTETFLVSTDSSPEASVRYYGEQYAVEEITVNVPDTILVGNTVQLSATVAPANAYDTRVIWSAENGTGAATVTSSGLLTATSAGTVTVTASALDGSGILGTAELQITEAPAGTATLTVGSASVISGKQVTINVDLSENTNIALLQFVLTYDSTVLRLDSAEPGDITDGFDAIINDSEPGIVRFVWDSTTGLTAGGTIMQMTFTALDIDTESLVSIVTDDADGDNEFICMNYQDDDYRNVDCIVYNGKVQVNDVMLGDINEDGKVNVVDANMARRAAVNLITLTDAQFTAGDVNGDGRVNVVDANYIRRYAVKIIDTFPIS